MIVERINQLVDYAITHGLITNDDRIWAVNRIIEKLQISSFEPIEYSECDDLEVILSEIIQYAVENGIVENEGKAYTDLFDTAVMGLLTPPPHEVIKTFWENYNISPETATDWYYDFSKATDYIRTYRVKKDLKWVVESDYGDIDITINLSKPEKDPKAIAAAKSAPQSGYPKCLLCAESEGFSGNLRYPARQNHRIIPMDLYGEKWYLQYSPYVYYNEHCIVLCSEHRPMQINRNLFERMMDFISILPHYFLGSNADLPIVGGSILSHDHMQGGRYVFAMEKAPIIKDISFAGYDDVEAGIVKWPLSVIRLTSDNRKSMLDLAEKILASWRVYSDEEAFVFAETNGEKHNTITPIARRKGEKYQLDLVLRNNITTDEYPLGVYHPHQDKHNIKKENIGLIEVMGLAVLPSRLKKEMSDLEEAILSGRDITSDSTLSKHSAWLDSFKDKYTFTKENTWDILKKEIGNTFVAVLEDAGVYKCNESGLRSFMKFVDKINK